MNIVITGNAGEGKSKIAELIRAAIHNYYPEVQIERETTARVEILTVEIPRLDLVR